MSVRRTTTIARDGGGCDGSGTCTTRERRDSCLSRRVRVYEVHEVWWDGGGGANGELVLRSHSKGERLPFGKTRRFFRRTRVTRASARGGVFLWGIRRGATSRPFQTEIIFRSKSRGPRASRVKTKNRNRIKCKSH